MTVPGGINSVGSVYVQVLTDTSGMQDAIDRQSARAGRSGGQAAAQRWEDSFNKRMAKSRTNVAKWNMTRAVDKAWDKIAARQAFKLQDAFRRGGPITIEVDDRELQELEQQLIKLAQALPSKQRAITVRRGLEEFIDRQTLAVQRILADIEKTEAARIKTADKVAKALQKEQDKFSNWLAGANYDEAVKKFAREIERKVPPSVAAALKKGVGNADLGPELNKRASQIAQAFGEAERDVRLRTGASIITLPDEKDVQRFDKLERRITLFNRRITSGGSLVTKILGGFLSLPIAAGGLVLKTLTAIPSLTAKAGGAVSKFGATVAKVFPKLGATLGRFGAALGAVAAKLAVVIAPIAIALALKSFQVVLSALVALANAAAAAMVMLGTTIVGVVANLVPAGIALGGFLFGLGTIALSVAPAVDAVQALNKAVASDKAEDWEKYNEAMGKLGPNAQASVKAIRPLIEGLKGFRNELSERFFDGMADSLARLGPTIEIVKNGFRGMATVAGDVVTNFITALSGPQFQGALTTILTGFQTIFASLGAAGTNFFLGLANAFAALTPFAVAMSDALKNISERFLAWTNSADNMAKLQGWFQKVYDVGAAVAGIVGSLIGLVASLFNQSAPGTTGALQGIKAKLDEWKLWVDNNKGTIMQWIEDGKGIVQDLAGAVGGVLTEFQKLNTPEAREGLSTIITVVEKALGFVARLAGAISAVWSALTGLSSAASQPINTSGNGRINTNARFGRSSGGSVDLNRPRNNGRAAGGLITRPELSWIGEAGPEVVVPLRRNLGLVDKDVRGLSAMLQGKSYKGQGGAGFGGKTVNVTQHITPASADPQVVASQMLNRLAVAMR